ncbi:hypothetical protein N9A76_03080 [Mariniblastus sp.]|nr:hypothetical protein [Mariniblastus sp.]
MNNNISLNTIQQVAFIVICGWFIVPAFQASGLARIAVCLAALVWGVCEYARSPDSFQHPPRSTVSLLLFMLLLVSIELLDGGWKTLRVHTFPLISMIIVLIGIQAQAKKQRDHRWSIFIILALACFVAITTVNKLQVDNWAARTVVRNTEEAGELMAENVGGYVFVYLASALCPLLFYVTLRLKSPDSMALFLRIVAAGMFIICCVAVWKAGFGLAVVASIGGCFIIIAPKSRPAFWLFATFALLLMWSANEQIFDNLEIATEGTPLHQKSIAIKEYLINSEAVNRINARQERYTRSIGLFFESPLIGQASRRDVGKHSTLLDAFAEFGLIGGFLFCFGMFEPIYRLYKRASPTQKQCIAALTFCLIVHMGLNNLTPGTTLVVYMMMPFGLAFVEDPTLRVNNADDHQFFPPVL